MLAAYPSTTTVLHSRFSFDQYSIGEDSQRVVISSSISSSDRYVTNFDTAVAIFCLVPGAELLTCASSITSCSDASTVADAFGKCALPGERKHSIQQILVSGRVILRQPRLFGVALSCSLLNSPWWFPLSQGCPVPGPPGGFLGGREGVERVFSFRHPSPLGLGRVSPRGTCVLWVPLQAKPTSDVPNQTGSTLKARSGWSPRHMRPVGSLARTADSDVPSHAGQRGVGSVGSVPEAHMSCGYPCKRCRL